MHSLTVEPTCSRHSLSVLLHASCGRSSHGQCARPRQRAMVLGWIEVNQACHERGLAGPFARACLPRYLVGRRSSWMTCVTKRSNTSACEFNRKRGHSQSRATLCFRNGTQYQSNCLAITKTSLEVMPTTSSLGPRDRSPTSPPHKRCTRFELRFLREQLVVQDRLFILCKSDEVDKRVHKRVQKRAGVTVRLRERTVTKLAFHILRGDAYIAP